MAVNYITQNDLSLLHMHKNQYIKVFLLNEDNLVIDEINGFIISGNGSEDSTSDIRRSCNFSIHSYDSDYNIGEYNRIWLNNRVRIELGYEYFDQIIYYNKGIFIFDSCSYTFDGSTRDITFQCSDLVTTLNGTHGGIIEGESFLIEGCTLNEETGLYEGNDIKKVVEDILTQNGIKEFRIDTIGQVSCLQGYATNWKQNRIDTGTTQEETDRDESNGYDNLENDHGTWHMIPYDMEFQMGVSLWDMLTKIRDLYPGYEMFFDIDGTFIFQLIPICIHDIDVLDHTQFEGLVLSEKCDYDFTSVKNATKIYGQSIETDRFSETCELINTNYKDTNVVSISPTFDMAFAYSGNIVLGVVFPEITDSNKNMNAYITINDETYPIVLRESKIEEDENGKSKNTIEYNNLKYEYFNNIDTYCFKFTTSKDQKMWVYTGMYQIEGYYENNDPNSPFAIDKIGKRLQVLSGGEYENITSYTLAQERAEYENWIASRLNDTVTLDIVIIPFLEVNQKIQYRKLSDGSID